MTTWTAPDIASIRGDNSRPLQKIFGSLTEYLKEYQIGYTLGSLSDVTVTTPTVGQLLSYDATNSLWINTTGSVITNLNASNLASGTVPTGRMTGAYTGITGLGTLTSLTIDGPLSPSVFFGDWNQDNQWSGIRGTHGYLLTGNSAGSTGVYLRSESVTHPVYIGSNNTNTLTVTNTSATVAGTMNATTFSGSGSSLTSLPAGQLTGTVASARISGSYTGITSVGTLSSPLSISAGTGVVIKAIENRLVSGTGQSAAMYLGDGSSGNTATGGIEVSWNSGNNDPIIGIGVTRDSNNTKITMSYAGIIRFTTQGTERMSITNTAVSFANGVTAPYLTATLTLTSNNTLNTFGQVQVYNPGVSYPGASVGGGSSNQIGFRWASPNVNCTVDNVISAVAANFSDRRIKTNIQTLTNGMDLIRSLRCVTYNPLDVIGFEEETFEPIIGDLDPYDEMIGFIADEVQEVYANAVNGEGNRLKSIDNVQLLSMAIAAIQDLDARLQQLETV